MPRRTLSAPLPTTLVLVVSSVVACGVDRTEVIVGSPLVAATITIRPPAGEAPNQAEADDAVEVLTSRLEGLAIGNYSISVADEIVVAIEDPADVFVVQRAVQTSGVIEFVPLPDGVPVPKVGANVDGLAPLWDGHQVESATVEDEGAGGRGVSIRFTAATELVLADWSADNVGHYLLVVLDRRVVAAPEVLGPLAGGLQITLVEADLPIPLDVFAAILASGPLPEGWRQP